MIKPQTNWVVIKIDYEQFKSQVKTLASGLKVDSRFNPYEYATVYGVVKDVCEDLYYRDKKGELSEAPLEYKGEIELRKGDEVYFNYLSCDKAVKTGRLFQEAGEDYVIIRYDRLYAILREGEWFGINGWKIIQPVEDNEVVEGFKVPKKENRGVVVGVGSPVVDYWDKKYPETGWLKRGDEIVYSHATPIENAILKTKNINLLRVREGEVLYKGDYEMNPTMFHVAPLENVRSSVLDLKEKIICRGRILHGGEGEVLYHKEFEKIVNGEYFVTRVADVIELIGEKALMPL